MANGPFFKTDYPKYLLDELGTRFNNSKTALPRSVVDMTVYSYNKSTKEYTIKSAIFKDCYVTGYNKGTTYTITSPGAGGMAGSSVPLSSGTGTYTTVAAPIVTGSLGGKTRLYNEPIAITDVKIDIGGTLGKVSRAEVTIKGAGKDKLEIVTDTITQLGNRVELEISAAGWSHKISKKANTAKYTGRIYDFTFNFSEAKGRFSATIKMVGLAEALSNINAFPEFSPRKPSYPSAWPKEFTPKDSKAPIPVNNLLILLDALWQQAFPTIMSGKADPTVDIHGLPASIYGAYLYKGNRPQSVRNATGFFSMFTSTEAAFQYYINLEGLRAVLMKILEVSADQVGNKVARQLEITYPKDASGNLVTNGSIVNYLDSANPDRILLFNNSIKNSGGTTYYPEPSAANERYKSFRSVNISPGDISNIYISRDVIFQAAGAKEGDTRYDVAGNKSIEKFLGSIFETIKNETGNIIDLILLPDFDAPNTGDDQEKLFIVDSNFTGPTAGNEIIQFPLFPDNTTHFRDVTAAPISLTAKVPKSLATKAFVKDANFVAVEQDSVDGDEAADDNTFDPAEIVAELTRLRDSLPDSDTWVEDGARRRELMVKLWQRHVHDTGAKSPKENIANTAEKRNIQTALELSMTSIGINGFAWGQAIALDYIPKTAPANTLFSIKNITHTFSYNPTSDLGGKWDTQISCNAHIRPAADKNMAKSVDSFTSLGSAGSGAARPKVKESESKEGADPLEKTDLPKKKTNTSKAGALKLEGK